MTEYQEIMQGKHKPDCLKCRKNCVDKDNVLFCTGFVNLQKEKI